MTDGSTKPGRSSRVGSLAAGRLSRHPRFWAAVSADTRVTLGFRGEPYDLRSTTAVAMQALRLCWATDAFFAQCCYRAKARLQALRVPVLPHIFHRLAIVTGQVCIGDPVVMDPGLCLPDGNVVIDGVTAVAAFAVIHGSVTLGLVDGNLEGPTIGPWVSIGYGAKIVGPVAVGTGARIEPGAVVVHAVEPGCIVAGIPARPVK